MKDTENLAEEPEVDYEHTSSAGETNISPFNQNEIEIEKPEFSVGFLMDKLEYNEINLNTEFQGENNLWSPKAAE